jgi:hypothetical protein
MRVRWRKASLILITCVWLSTLLNPSSAMAAPPSSAPLFAESYSSGFVEYWKKAMGKTDNIVLVTIGIGAVCIAIILAGGRWKK